MHEVEAVCDRVLFLSHGKILLEGDPRKLPVEYEKKNLEGLFIAWVMFVYNIFQFGVLLVPFLTIILVFGLALGIFATALVLRFGPPAEWIAWIIPFVLDPFTGIFYPISALPKVLQPISAILPPSYVFEGMRSALFSGKFSVSHLIVGISIAFVYLITSCLFFLYIYRIVLRKGLIARLTAENL